MKRTMIITSLAALGVWTALAQKTDTGVQST